MQLALCVHVDNVGPHIDRMAAAAARSKMRAKWQREKFGINFHSIGFWKTPWSWGCRLNAGSKTTNVCRCRVCLTNLLLFFLCCFSGYFFFFTHFYCQHSFLCVAFFFFSLFSFHIYLSAAAANWQSLFSVVRFLDLYSVCFIDVLAAIDWNVRQKCWGSHALNLPWTPRIPSL